MLPQTLLEMAGVTPKPSALSESAILVVDAQEEYRSGKLPLEGIDAAVEAIGDLLTRARGLGVPVHHIVHEGRPGGLFDPASPEGAPIADIGPRIGESVTRKTLPNSFAGTNLADILAEHGRKKLIIVGFMNHMCVDATTRAASEQGFMVTIPADCTATRDLASPVSGDVLTAKIVKEASLAGLADRFATVVPTIADIPDKAE
ncbi:MAG: cysteine hydrolase [Hyphomicrobiales bacterium]|nr:MAG: cysteine hydrolase [Hyphomicrobiales bacterium]